MSDCLLLTVVSWISHLNPAMFLTHISRRTDWNTAFWVAKANLGHTANKAELYPTLTHNHRPAVFYQAAFVSTKTQQNVLCRFFRKLRYQSQIANHPSRGRYLEGRAPMANKNMIDVQFMQFLKKK